MWQRKRGPNGLMLQDNDPQGNQQIYQIKVLHWPIQTPEFKWLKCVQDLKRAMQRRVGKISSTAM